MKGNSSQSITAISGGDERCMQSIKTLLDEEGQRTSKLNALLLVVALLVLVFLAWSFMAEVEELAKARGEIRPVSKVQKLQSDEGGIIDKVLVEADQFVEKGQAIARFLSTNIHKDKAQMMVRRSALQINLERWGAIVESRTPDFSEFENYPELVNEAKSLYQNQLLLDEATKDSKAGQLNQLRSQLVGLKSQLPSAERELNLIKDVLKRQEDALVQGVVSEVQVSEAKQRVASTERSLLELRSRVNDTQKSILTAQSDLNQTSDQIKQDALEMRNEILEQIAEVSEEIVALDTRQGRREILAPIAGFIQNIPETLEGAVIEAGGLVAEIVPSEGGTYMEAMVAPKDIGFIRKGQEAIVKVDSYDFSRFGSVAGTVKDISPTAFKNERDGSSFYKVNIELEKQFMANDERRRLIPGMTGEVDIVTGKKTVFQYLAKPVFISLDTAFSER